MYNYTFYAGSTCAYPDINVTITDDMILEPEEYFEISIIRLILPFGVEAGPPAKIFINDNDSKCDKVIIIMLVNLYLKHV